MNQESSNKDTNTTLDIINDISSTNELGKEERRLLTRIATGMYEIRDALRNDVISVKDDIKSVRETVNFTSELSREALLKEIANTKTLIEKSQNTTIRWLMATFAVCFCGSCGFFWLMFEMYITYSPK